MNRIELGKRLVALRSELEIFGLSQYAIQSLEAGRSSYSVSNLFLYTDAIGCSVFVWDYNIDEHYRIGSMDDCHELIMFLMQQNKANINDMSSQIGIRYTKPKGGHTSLSIDTLLAILSYFHCLVQITKQHQWF